MNFTAAPTVCKPITWESQTELAQEMRKYFSEKVKRWGMSDDQIV